MNIRTKRILTDVLVVGGGGAGLRAAIEARKYGANTLLVSKIATGYGNCTSTSWGFLNATGFNSEDNPEKHLKDTISGGRYINNQKLVDVMTRRASSEVSELMKIGVKFKTAGNKIKLFTTAGNTYPRGLVAEKERGTAITEPLLLYAKNIGVSLMNDVFIVKLLSQDNFVTGAIGIDKLDEIIIFQAKSVVLATGGAGSIYDRTSNPGGTTGDGYALAYEIGVPLVDMEFVQFYPTVIFQPTLPHTLIVYELSIKEDGAILRNNQGHDILKKYGLDELSKITRDNICIAVMREILNGKGIDRTVLMDFTAVPMEKYERYPFKADIILKRLFSKDSKMVQVTPVAHYCMGGIKINEKSETCFENLYAAGEVAGGIQGANRLGGNSITDILVFGSIAGKNAAEKTKRMAPFPSVNEEKADLEIEEIKSLISPEANEELLNQVSHLAKKNMWLKVGAVRSEKGLLEALKKFSSLREEIENQTVKNFRQLVKLLELKNILQVSEIICRAALSRTESRGSHFREDYPKEDNKRWLKHSLIQKTNGEITVRTLPPNS